MMRKLTTQEELLIESKLEEYHDSLMEEAESYREQQLERWEMELEEGEEIYKYEDKTGRTSERV